MFTSVEASAQLFHMFLRSIHRSEALGECLTSLPVPLTHCSHPPLIPTGVGHLELCSHTQIEEDLLKFLMGSTVTFLILWTSHTKCEKLREFKLSIISSLPFPNYLHLYLYHRPSLNCPCTPHCVFVCIHSKC